MRSEPETPSSAGEPPEELRLLVLLRVYEVAGEDPAVEVRGREIAGDLEMPLATAFAILEHLSRKGDLEYLGAGPRVSITPHGVSRLAPALQIGQRKGERTAPLRPR